MKLVKLIMTAQIIAIIWGIGLVYIYHHPSMAAHQIFLP